MPCLFRMIILQLYAFSPVCLAGRSIGNLETISPYMTMTHFRGYCMQVLLKISFSQTFTAYGYDLCILI